MTNEELDLLLYALPGIILLGVFFFKLYEIARTLKDINRKLPDSEPEHTSPNENEKAPD